MKLKKLNVLFRETMGSYEEYKSNNYEVKSGDTLYSVLNDLGKKNGIPKDLIKKALHEANSNIKPGDKISFELQDNNSAELTINNETIIINNNEESEQISRLEKQFKEEINKNLESRDKKLNEIYKTIDKLINETDIEYGALADGFYDEVLKIQKVLHSPKYKNNPEAQRAIKLIDVLALEGDLNVTEQVKVISRVFDDPNISYLNKQKIAKYLRENHLGFLTEDLGNGNYISDPLKGVEIANELEKKYPKYNFENFRLVSDPEGGEVYTNDIK